MLRVVMRALSDPQRQQLPSNVSDLERAEVPAIETSGRPGRYQPEFGRSHHVGSARHAAERASVTVAINWLASCNADAIDYEAGRRDRHSVPWDGDDLLANRHEPARARTAAWYISPLRREPCHGGRET